jgi:RimJ/RimL family protein N-acetyltransferase
VWGLYRKIQPDELIGAVDLWREGKPQHRGFWLGEAYWGQGFMTEAVAPITEYAFTQLCFEELVFDNAKGNRGSRRIKEKPGQPTYAPSRHSLSTLAIRNARFGY